MGKPVFSQNESKSKIFRRLCIAIFNIWLKIYITLNDIEIVHSKKFNLNIISDFAEKLFKQLEGMTERFEVKLMQMDLISRLIGVHQLFLLNFYPYIQRFLQPHQRGIVLLLSVTVKISSNNKTLNARLLARVITGCHYT